VPPEASVAAVSASTRLDDAVRGFLTEQGSKKLSKDDLWALVNSATRLRLTAHTLAGLRPAAPADPSIGVVPGGACLPLPGSDGYAGASACTDLRLETAELAGFYGSIAQEVGRPAPGPTTVTPPLVMAPAMPRRLPSANGAGPDANPPEANPADAHATELSLPHPHLLWVQEHLHHLSKDAQSVSEPAQHLAEVRRRPWWR
jgi:hypothetical protein